MQVANLKKKKAIQALDKDWKQWLKASVVQVGETEVKVSWTGYGRAYDLWLSLEHIREPIPYRSLLSRKGIDKTYFPERGHPKNIRFGDTIFDTGRNANYVVQINDPFKMEVRLLHYIKC